MKTIEIQVKSIDIPGMFSYCYDNNIPFRYDAQETIIAEIDEEFAEEFQKRIDSNNWSEAHSVPDKEHISDFDTRRIKSILYHLSQVKPHIKVVVDQCEELHQIIGERNRQNAEHLKTTLSNLEAGLSVFN